MSARTSAKTTTKTNATVSTAKLWKSDDELFAIVQRELFTCVVGDVMDKLGLQHQFLPPQIQPLRQDMVVIDVYKRQDPNRATDRGGHESTGGVGRAPQRSGSLVLPWPRQRFTVEAID